MASRYSPTDGQSISLGHRRTTPDKEASVGVTPDTYAGLQPLETLPTREDGKIILTEEYCQGKLGFDFSTFKKWSTLCVIFAVQVSMNFNASVYGNAITGMQQEFHISSQMSKVGQCVFLIAYGFGSEFWAPWSEELGRFPIMQASLFFVNMSQLFGALGQNYVTIVIGRFFGGLSSAGGSVTLGMIADMWGADTQQYALNFMVLSSCGGSALGPIFGCFIEKYLNWHWVFWIQMIVGGVVQLIHFLVVPETNIKYLVDKEAKRLRKEDPTKYGHIKGPGEDAGWPPLNKVLRIWARPFVMFATEPIVLWLSLLSGFSDALIFMFIDSFGLVFDQWGFSLIAHGMTFVPIVVAYLVAYLIYFPILWKHQKIRNRDPRRLQPESRLTWLCWTAPFLTIGLIGFAVASLGPPIHWIIPMVFVFLVAIANYNIYMGTVDYMVAAYGPEYSASATGGNALARDALAGAAAMWTHPLYTSIGSKRLQLIWPTVILAGLAFLLTIALYIIYGKGPTIRENSKMALDIGHHREDVQRRRSTLNIEQITAIRRNFPQTRQPSPEPNSNEADEGSEHAMPEPADAHNEKRAGQTADTRRPEFLHVPFDATPELEVERWRLKTILSIDQALEFGRYRF